jgi:diguanylate cyclase (GGDEF)-like protein
MPDRLASLGRFQSLPAEPLTFLQFAVGVNSSDRTTSEVVAAMGQAQVGCVLLMDGTRLAGIFTAADLIRTIATGADLTKLAITEVMTSGVMTLAETSTPIDVVAAFEQHGVGYLPVLSQTGEVLQVLRAADMPQPQVKTQAHARLRRSSVREVVTPQVLQIAPDQTLQQAAKILSNRHGNYLVVTTANDLTPNDLTPNDLTPIGVLTQGDLVQAQIFGQDFRHDRVSDVMSAPPRSIGLDDSLWMAYQQMQRYFLRRLVVVNQQGELAGILRWEAILGLLDPIALYQTTLELQAQVNQQAMQLEQVQLKHQESEFDRRRMQQELQNMQQQLDRLAYLDILTQTFNRRHFDQLLAQEWQRLRRDKQPIAVLLADIDFFQEYNDHHGHLRGDNCLKQVAGAIIEATQRSSDIVARYGGEEFAILLPHTDLAGMILLTERIQVNLARLKIEHPGSIVSQYITLSFGLATCMPSLGASFADLLTAADRAMYRAKEQGRNTYRVTIENEFSTKPRFKILDPAEVVVE